jgi:hypothetical protein
MNICLGLDDGEKLSAMFNSVMHPVVSSDIFHEGFKLFMQDFTIHIG